WADQLGALVRQAKPPTTGVDWSEPEAASTAPAGRVVGRASVVRGTETDYFRRVEALEREVVQLRDKVLPGSIPTPGAPGRLVSTAAYAGRPLDNGAAPNDRGPVAPAVGSVSGGTSPESPSDPVPPAGANGAGGPGGDQPGADAAGSEGAGGNVVAVGARIGPAGGGAAGTPMVGRAAVGPRRAPVLDETGTPIATRVRVREPAGALKVGANFTWFSAIFAFVCWSVWAVFNRTQSLILPLLAFALALLVAAGLFTLLRLVGRLVMVRWLNRPRRTARVAHFLTGAFLIAVGVSYIGSTSWIMQIVHWFS
ncbi:MAG: hypothetical protein J2P15_08405, partial [Micromonosporaceae bacterium]|nr:hypothetical protein [Micromonosporaceae bacterium]